MKSAQSSSTYSKNWNNSVAEKGVLDGYFLKIKLIVGNKCAFTYKIEFGP